MNGVFAEYATGVAFSIQLSKNQCNALLRVDVAPLDILVQVSTLRTLEARGLVFWHRDSHGKNHGFGGLTEAGRLMVGLLREAGLTVKNTNTVGMLRRIEREAA
jgi:hypothetical protein